jgi:glutamate N-acetyltransferase/amino-acid N-acetyltransferase
MAAIGYSGAYVREENVSITFGDINLVNNGAGLGKSVERKVIEVMNNREYTITIDLNVGDAEAAVLTTDLSYEYVKINVAYRS